MVREEEDVQVPNSQLGAVCLEFSSTVGLLELQRAGLVEESDGCPYKEMVNVYGDRNNNYPDLTTTHYIHISNFHTVPHKYV